MWEYKVWMIKPNGGEQTYIVNAESEHEARMKAIAECKRNNPGKPEVRFAEAHRFISDT